jgi:hypoxanthine phosphoribosyltransferase
MNKRYLTYQHIEQQVAAIAQQLTTDQWKPDLIVALSRGGLLPGVRLSYLLDLPCRAVNLSLRDHPTNQLISLEWQQVLTAERRRVLVVDDINDSGDTILAVKQGWKNLVENNFQDQVRFAVLLNKNSSTVCADYWAEAVDYTESQVWWVFPWENTAA